MPYYKVVEIYPQAVVRAELIIQAPNAGCAQNNPHEQVILSKNYDIDEGGEAITESCKRIKRIKRPKQTL